MGIQTTIKEKTISTQFEDFIDSRTIDHGDIIEEFSFKYVNTKHCPTTRIPKELTEEMEMRSKILETYGALSATTTKILIRYQQPTFLIMTCWLVVFHVKIIL